MGNLRVTPSDSEQDADEKVDLKYASDTST